MRQSSKSINGMLGCRKFSKAKLSFTAIPKMNATRIFHGSNFLQPTDEEPIRSVVTESKDAIVVAWYIKPGQKISAHTHPNGQDTWTVLSGKGEYYLDQLQGCFILNFVILRIYENAPFQEFRDIRL